MGLRSSLRFRVLALDKDIVIWQISNMAIPSAGLRALANEKRLQILEWLKDPRAHFPPQVDGDLVKDGVCGVRIAEKLGVSQPTVSEHMRVLSQAGLVRGKRIRQWTFYRRDEARIREVKRSLSRI
jgi:DNA-binding transcriptional ArsR family regulator